MTRAYTAILQGNRLEWTGEPPDSISPGMSVPVTVLVEEATQPVEPGADPDRWKRAVDALRRIAARGAFDHITDPVEWQREIRKDRPLLGREEE